RPVVERHVDLDRRVAPRVQDLPRVDGVDGGQGGSPGICRRGGFLARFRYWSLAEQTRSLAAATPPQRPRPPPLAPRRKQPRRRKRSGGVAALALGPAPDSVPVTARGGPQLQLGVKPCRARLGYDGEQRRPDLAHAVRCLTVGARRSSGTGGQVGG